MGFMTMDFMGLMPLLTGEKDNWFYYSFLETFSRLATDTG